MLQTPFIMEQQTSGIWDDLWFKLRGIERLTNSGMAQQLTTSYVLVFVKQGTGRITIDLQEYSLHKETVRTIAPGQTMGIVAEQGRELDAYVIFFQLYSDRLESIALPFQGDLPVHPESQLNSLSDSMYSSWHQGNELERFRSQSYFHVWMYELIKNIRTEREITSRSALEESKEYLENHYFENLTIEQLARIARISPKYYVDLFKKTYGKSAIDYLTEVRVNRAKQLMLHSGARLREIAHQVGYHDEFYFSRKFKKVVGMSPKAYMRDRQNRIVAYSPHILGHLLALRMLPYAAPLHPKWTAYYYKMYRADIALHLSAYRANEDWEENLQSLSQASPNIIISRDDCLHPLERERLDRIAPLIVLPGQDKSWREHLVMIAQQLGVERVAYEWLQGYEMKVNQAKEQLHRLLANETILAISIHKQKCRLCPVRGMKEVLFDDLGLLPPPGIDPDSCNMAIDLNQLAELQADILLVNVCQEEETLRYWEELRTSQLWLDLKPVRRNRVYPIASDPWREYSAHASERMVDDLLRLLIWNSSS